MKKTSLLLTCTGAVLVLGLAACNGGGGGGGSVDPDTYTYRGYSASLATNWNPHSWETNADSGVLDYLSEGFVSLQPKDTAKGEYQWAFDMAESVTDVTKSSKSDLVKYVGMTQEEADDYVNGLEAGNEGQYVYQIKLRDGLKWQDGSAINADSFINSGKLLLDPKMKNYRANNYVAGTSAIAGGFGYYYAGAKGYFDATTKYSTFEPSIYGDLVFCLSGELSGKTVYSPSYLTSYFAEYEYTYEEILDYFEYYGGPAATDNQKLEGKTLSEIVGDPTLKAIWDADVEFWCSTPNEELTFFVTESELPEATWDTVGLYKVDDKTFNYVMETPLDRSQTLVSFTSNWLVHEKTYNDNKDTSGALTTTTYGTKVATTMSFGPYKLESLQESKQMVFVQNENWWGYTKQADGTLKSEALFEVDGKKVEQFKTTKIVIDVLDDAAAKQKFLAGELTEYSPTAAELPEYALSDALYQVDETYTMSLFFNSNLDALKEMDKSKGNTNSVVLSNTEFRKAFSLAIDRAEWVGATEAYKPAYALLNNLYYYDVWNNPQSQYRSSEPAMQAVCKLYGVEYGAGKTYATLEEAYKSITGYNLTEAQKLMKSACEALTQGGLYKAGDAITIKLGYAAGALQDAQLQQIALLNKYINAAAAGSGFGTITLEGVGNISNRYKAVPEGEYAIGYGAWGGAAFAPFGMMQLYCDPDYTSVNEIACYDPTTEELKIEFEYKGQLFSDTMTWQKWSQSMEGTGKYANADNEIKLRILATLEEGFLERFYRIPLAGSTASFLLGYQVSYLTEEYNIMYGFGGLRLMKYNYTDKGWAKYVSDHGGKIDYK